MLVAAELTTEDSALPALVRVPADTAEATSRSAGPGMMLATLRLMSGDMPCAVKERAVCCCAPDEVGMGMGGGRGGIVALAAGAGAASVVPFAAEVDVTVLSEMVPSHVPDTAEARGVEGSCHAHMLLLCQH